MIQADMPESVSSPGPTPAICVVRKPRRAQPIDAEGYRVCTYCAIRKHRSEFQKRVDVPNGITGCCLDCVRRMSSASAIKRYRANPEKYRKTKAENHKERLSQKYGITVERYNEMLADQGGGCAICGSRYYDRLGRRLGVDHNHKTGKVRGLLCHQCNIAIGGLRDRTDLLRRAICYLDKSNQEE